jgi:hypothetical protein
LLEEHLQKQMDKVRQEINEAKILYFSEVNRLRDLVLKMRNGTSQQETIIEMLAGESEISLQSRLYSIVKRRQTLIDKAEFIVELNDRRVQYRNMEDSSIQKEDDIKTNLKKLFTQDNSKLILC